MPTSPYVPTSSNASSPLPNRRQVLRAAAAVGAGAVLAANLPGEAYAAGSGDALDYDVVVVGAGAAGMTAALTAAKSGLRVVVVEKAPTFGGSAARSGAGIWLRCNEVLLAAGVPDTPAKAAAYLASVVGPDVPADRQAAFLAYGPVMLDFVLKHSPLRFRWMEGYSDYYPEHPGAMADGASIEPEIFDGNLLGAELANLNAPYIPTPPGVVVYSSDYKWLTLATVSGRGAATALACASRYVEALLRGEKPLSMGQALAAGLRAGLLAAEVPVLLNTPLVDLQFDRSGRTTGVVVLQDGVQTTIKAARGVIIASGGFEHNASMRAEFQRAPIGTEWTVGAKENTGDGIRAGRRAGAALALMDDAWWGPTIPLPDGPYFCLAERTLPGSILVNSQGQRFVNEGAPYVDVVHAMYAHTEARANAGASVGTGIGGDSRSSGSIDDGETQPSAIPAWLIVDQKYKDRYLFRDVLPGLPLPDAWYEHGAVYQEATLAGLALKIGLPPQALTATVERFNSFAAAGVDPDFHRGRSLYDHYYTDPDVGPNSCLGALAQAPYYAFRIVPGDLGTKGGLLTDAVARVLRANGTTIPGLYAAGNASAAVMGHSYAGAGSTIGPAMTFGYIAAMDLVATPPPAAD